MTEQSESDAREELRRLDEQLTELRREVAELRRRIAEGWDTPRDQADVSAALTLAEEQEALIDVLEQRRAVLLDRLDETP